MVDALSHFKSLRVTLFLLSSLGDDITARRSCVGGIRSEASARSEYYLVTELPTHPCSYDLTIYLYQKMHRFEFI